MDWIVDWRGKDLADLDDHPPDLLPVLQCPTTWTELQAWMRRARLEGKHLALAYPQPIPEAPEVIWQRFVGLAKYLSRTQKTVTRSQLLEKLGMGDRTLQLAFQLLGDVGCQAQSTPFGFQLVWNLPNSLPSLPPSFPKRLEALLNWIQEERFRQQYFYAVPLPLIQRMAGEIRPSFTADTVETPH
ncbi:MAG: hypothetical protein SFW36_05240 [Leptolyngbyaceae cyanobacterium bins.59]|nr:hypothetical protein [Leptolyngbyaceae cyanobacterium bins.59]